MQVKLTLTDLDERILKVMSVATAGVFMDGDTVAR